MLGLRAAALLALVALGAKAPGAKPQESPVGVTAVLRDVVLPGPELEVRPSDFTTPLVLRIADVRPHGSALRYDLVYYGLDPGEYDLCAFLRRRTGEDAAGLPPLLVRVVPTLPPGEVQPNPLRPKDVPAVGGYRALLWALGGAWVLGIVGFVVLGRRRRAEAAQRATRGETLAERLRPLVERARAGTLSREDRARLELALIAYWRRKRDLEELGAARALAELREDREAGPLLRSLEEWLHRPANANGAHEPDLAALLAPYQDLAADELELAASARTVVEP